MTNSKNIWLDHLDIADGQDGNCDITSGSDLVTISWCKFSYTYEKDHAFSNLNGSADDATGDKGKLNITFHHNWWADRIQQRQPRVRFGKIHVANNLYTSQKSEYLVGVGMGALVLVEGNVMKATGKVMEYFGQGYAKDVLTRNNIGLADANATLGSGFIPPYLMPIDLPTFNLEALLTSCAGATLGDPRLATALETSTAPDERMIFPNPFKDILYLTSGEEVKGEVLDIQGKLLLPFEGVSYLNLSSFRAGLYLVRYQRGEIVYTRPIQKIE